VGENWFALEDFKIAPLSSYKYMPINDGITVNVNENEAVIMPPSASYGIGILLGKLPIGTYTVSFSSYTSGSLIDFTDTIDFSMVNPTMTNKDFFYERQQITFTSTGKQYCWLCLFNAKTQYTISEIMLNLGNQKIEYKSYHNDQISVTFPTTIYGGEDEVISGKLKSTMGIVDLGTLNWTSTSIGGNNAFMAIVSDMVNDSTNRTDFYCDRYASKAVVVSGNAWINQQRIIIIDNSYTTAADFKTTMSGAQLVYPLATPVEYALDGEELTTLYGTNNIWASTGDTEVTYPADTKLYIDGKLAEIQATILENIGG
jgi:hypothetical protein